MDNNKIIKFKDFTNEDTYKVNDAGKIEKQEWELYKDWHPLKFKVLNLTKKGDITPYEKGEFVWIIKRNDNIVATLSSELSEEKINSFFELLKSDGGSDNTNDENINETEDSNL